MCLFWLPKQGRALERPGVRPSFSSKSIQHGIDPRISSQRWLPDTGMGCRADRSSASQSPHGLPTSISILPSEPRIPFLGETSMIPVSTYWEFIRK